MVKTLRTLLIASIIGIGGDTDHIAAANSAETVVVAHRGAAGYAPENTMAAFELAYRMQSSMIELDVQRSLDGELVVIHDLTLDRTTSGTGEVRMHTLAELRSWMREAGSEESIAASRFPRLKRFWHITAARISDF